MNNENQPSATPRRDPTAQANPPTTPPNRPTPTLAPPKLLRKHSEGVQITPKAALARYKAVVSGAVEFENPFDESGACARGYATRGVDGGVGGVADVVDRISVAGGYVGMVQAARTPGKDAATGLLGVGYNGGCNGVTPPAFYSPAAGAFYTPPNLTPDNSLLSSGATPETPCCDPMFESPSARAGSFSPYPGYTSPCGLGQVPSPHSPMDIRRPPIFTDKMEINEDDKENYDPKIHGLVEFSDRTNVAARPKKPGNLNPRPALASVFSAPQLEAGKKRADSKGNRAALYRVSKHAAVTAGNYHKHGGAGKTMTVVGMGASKERGAASVFDYPESEDGKEAAVRGRSVSLPDVLFP